MESEDNNATPSPSAADARRRSGRVVRAPRKFTEETQNDTSSKRKRTRENEDDVENEEPHDSLEEASDEEPADESEEDLAPRQKKSKARTKRPAAKKPKTNGSGPVEASASQAPAVRLASRPKKTVRVAIARKDGDGLYGETSKCGLEVHC
jgi:cohesin complex subunit SA-1/2